MKKSIFYFDKLETWDKVSILGYTILSVFLWFYYIQSNSSETRQTILFCYIFGTHLCLYGFNYKSLRNMTVFVIWILIGSIHFGIYLYLKCDISLMSRGNIHAALGFRNTIPLLILFQSLRIVNIKIQKQELVAPSRSSTDLFEDRRINFMDVISFFVYLAATVFLSLTNLT